MAVIELGLATVLLVEQIKPKKEEEPAPINAPLENHDHNHEEDGGTDAVNVNGNTTSVSSGGSNLDWLPQGTDMPLRRMARTYMGGTDAVNLFGPITSLSSGGSLDWLVEGTDMPPRRRSKE